MEFWPEFMASSWGREFFAGGIGGIAGVISGYPLDTLRVRLQQPLPPSSAPSLSGAGGAATALSGSARRIPSAVQLLRSIVTREGPAALYRGMTAPLASITFQNALVFQLYAVLSRSLESKLDNDNQNRSPSYTTVAVAGVGTGAIQSLMLSPVELIKIRLQLQMAGDQQYLRSREGPLDMAKKILRTEGIAGIYRGFWATVLRDAPAHGVYFWSYEYAREKLHRGFRGDGGGGNGESLGIMLVAGGLAGVASWVCCYPVDVLKSRIQAQPPPEASATRRLIGEEHYRGIVDCFAKSVRAEGYQVLCRGLGTAVTRAFVVNAAIFSAYELALGFLPTANQRITLEQN